MQLDWSLRALADRKRIYAYYWNTASERIADTVDAAIAERTRAIAKLDLVYRRGKGSTRECVMRRFPFTIIYRRTEAGAHRPRAAPGQGVLQPLTCRPASADFREIVVRPLGAFSQKVGAGLTANDPMKPLRIYRVCRQSSGRSHSRHRRNAALKGGLTESTCRSIG